MCKKGSVPELPRTDGQAKWVGHWCALYLWLWSNAECCLYSFSNRKLTLSATFYKFKKISPWGEFVKISPWGEFVKISPWGEFVKTSPWGEFVKISPWGEFVKISPWGEFVKISPWGEFVKISPWGEFVKISPWGEFVKISPWGEFVKISPWGEFVKISPWGEFVKISPWGEFVKISPWGEFVKISPWGEFVKISPWGEFVKISPWGEFVHWERFASLIPCGARLTKRNCFNLLFPRVNAETLDHLGPRVSREIRWVKKTDVYSPEILQNIRSFDPFIFFIKHGRCSPNQWSEVHRILVTSVNKRMMTCKRRCFHHPYRMTTACSFGVFCFYHVPPTFPSFSFFFNANASTKQSIVSGTLFNWVYGLSVASRSIIAANFLLRRRGRGQ